MSIALDPEWWEVLADVASDLLADRQKGYPKLVLAGRMTQAEADDGIRIMASIAAQWRRITDLYAGKACGPEDESATRAEKRATLASAADRLHGIFNRAFASLPRLMPAAMGSLGREMDRNGLTIEDLVRQSSAQVIASDVLRTAVNAYNRMRAADMMRLYEDRDRRPAFFAEVDAEMKARARAMAA